MARGWGGPGSATCRSGGSTYTVPLRKGKCGAKASLSRKHLPPDQPSASSSPGPASARRTSSVGALVAVGGGGGPLDADGTASPERSARWWWKSAAFDAECRERFAALHAAIARGELEHWLSASRSCVAYVIARAENDRQREADSAAERAFLEQPGSSF